MTTLQKLSITAILIAVGVLIFFLTPVLKPFYLALVLAYITNPLVHRLTYFKIPRPLGVILVFLLIFTFITLLIIWLVPSLIKQINLVIEKTPFIIDWLQLTAIPWINEHVSKDLQVNFANTKAAIINSWKSSTLSVTDVVKTLTHSGFTLVGWIINFLLVPVVVFYLLRDWPKVINATHKLIPKHIEPTVVMLAKESNDVLAAFFRGQLSVMVFLGIIYATGLWLVGLNLALLIGLIAGILSIVPYLGTFIGVLSALIAAYFQFDNPIYLVYVLIVFVVGNSLEGMVLTPLLVGDRIGLHPVAVIFAVLIGAYLFGFIGALLALPVAAVIMVVLRYITQQYYKSPLYK